MPSNLSLKIAPVFRRNIRPSKKDTPNLLFRLPPELRNYIYTLVLPQSSYVNIINSNMQFMIKDPPLFRTCKQIRQEACSMYYANNEIYAFIDLSTDSMKQLVRKLHAIVSTCGQKPFSKFLIHFCGVQVSNHLEKVLPLLELIRHTGFEPSTKPYRLPDGSAWDGARDELQSSVFSLQRKATPRTQFILEKALCLARRARAGGWGAERLAKVYIKFATEQAHRGKKGKIFVEGKAL